MTGVGALATGEVARKFHFIREIASGGFGSVFLAKVVHGDGFSRLVAIKLLHQKWTENQDVASRMRDEARLLGWLRHKNIVDVLDLTLIDGRVAVIMEYLEAVDMKVVINAAKYYKTMPPPRAIFEVGASVASALDAAYNRPPFAGEKPLRVIHRDIKPSNVMVDGTGTVKVLDFGVARAEFDQREAKTQELSFGSVDYMPPERLFFEPETAASDVYSLGVSLYEMLALEKFGKAKLRADQHDQMIRERLDELFDRNRMPSEAIEDAIYDVLFDMLAFNEAERISAGDVSSRLRAIAREIPDLGVEEWAEKFIPPLVAAAAQVEQKSPNPLVGKVLSEDSAGFSPGAADDSDGLPPATTEETPVVKPVLVDDVEDDELDHTGKKDDLRWKAIKEATLSELGTVKPDPPSEALPELELDSTAPPPPPRVASVPPVANRAASGVPAPPKLASVTPVAGRSEPPRSPPPVVAAVTAVAAPAGAAPSRAVALAAEDAATEDVAPVPRRGGWAGFLVAGGVLLVGVAALLVVVLAGVAVVVGYGLNTTAEVGRPEPTVEAPVKAEEVAPAVVPAPEATAVPVPAAAPVPAAEPSPAPAASPAPEPSPAVMAAPAPAPSDANAAAVEPALGGSKFVSALPSTKKLSVRCDGDRGGDGTTEAFVAGDGLANCTISAVDTARKRYTAVVKAAEPRAYRCFEAAEMICN